MGYRDLLLISTIGNAEDHTGGDGAVGDQVIDRVVDGLEVGRCPPDLEGVVA